MFSECMASISILGGAICLGGTILERNSIKSIKNEAHENIEVNEDMLSVWQVDLSMGLSIFHI